jgi:hypothetical protein
MNNLSIVNIGENIYSLENFAIAFQFTSYGFQKIIYPYFGTNMVSKSKANLGHAISILALFYLPFD